MEFESKRGSLCWAQHALRHKRRKGGLVWACVGYAEATEKRGGGKGLIRLLCSIAEQKLGAFEKERGRGNLPAWSIRSIFGEKS